MKFLYKNPYPDCLFKAMEKNMEVILIHIKSNFSSFWKSSFVSWRLLH